MTRLYSSFLILCVALLFSSVCISQVSNIQSGVWSDITIWPNNELPTITDDVVLKFDITIDQNSYCKSLNNNGYKVIISSGANLFINTANPRTSNIFGFTVSKPTCRIDSVINIVSVDSTSFAFRYNNAFHYNNELLGKITFPENPGYSKLFFYDTLNRLSKIIYNEIFSSYEFKMKYTAPSNRISNFYYSAEPTNPFEITDTFNITYPDAGKVVISINNYIPGADIAAIIDSFYFDSNRNPIRWVRNWLKSTGIMEPSFLVTASYNLGILNPWFNYAANDLEYFAPYYDIHYVFDNGIEYYQGMPISGLNYRSAITFTSFIKPSDSFIGQLVSTEVNTQGYLLKETLPFAGYDTTSYWPLLYHYTCH